MNTLSDSISDTHADSFLRNTETKMRSDSTVQYSETAYARYNYYADVYILAETFENFDEL